MADHGGLRRCSSPPVVIVFAQPLMMLFIDGAQTAIIAEGVRYLRIEGAFYPLIGLLFLFYGIYRALGRARHVRCCSPSPP